MKVTNSFSADEYYWYYQSELKQSQLNFQKLLGNFTPKEQKLSSLKKIHPFRNDLEEKSRLDTLQLQSKVLKSAPEETKEQILLSKIDAPYSLSFMKKWLPMVLNTIKSANTLPKIKEPREKTVEIAKPIACRFQFNDFQLFIESKQGEICLNTGNLDQQQIKMLRESIKKWFENQGIFLQQFIINGEKQ